MTEQRANYTVHNANQDSDEPQHQHTYQVTATETVIVRWCLSCGKAWKIVRSVSGGLFTNIWEEISEPRGKQK